VISTAYCKDGVGSHFEEVFLRPALLPEVGSDEARVSRPSKDSEVVTDEDVKLGPV